MSRWTPVFTLLVGIVIGVIIGSSSSSSSSYHRPRPPSKPHYIFIKAATLNVRAKPSTTSVIVRQLVWGDSAREINRRGKWVKIIVGFDTAWVHRDFVGTKADFKRAVLAQEREAKAKVEKRYEKERAEAKRQRKLKEEAYKQKQSSNRVALFKQWAKEVEYGCRSRAAVFRKSWLGWELTLTTYPNAHVEAVSTLFPNDHNKIERTLEEISAGDPVLYATYLRHIDACEESKQ